jgi:hypothetical protein
MDGRMHVDLLRAIPGPRIYRHKAAMPSPCALCIGIDDIHVAVR